MWLEQLVDRIFVSRKRPHQHIRHSR
jgi:hypothetical protein